MCLTRSTIFRAPLFYNKKKNISTATINFTFDKSILRDRSLNLSSPGWLRMGRRGVGGGVGNLPAANMNFYFDIPANAMKHQDFLGNLSGKYLMWSVGFH